MAKNRLNGHAEDGDVAVLTRGSKGKIAKSAKNGKATAEKAPAGKKLKEPTVVLNPLDRRMIEVELIGDSPLIMHAWDPKVQKMLGDEQIGAGRIGRKKQDPEAEYQAAMYKDHNGRYCFPAGAFKKAFVSAATSIGDRINYSKAKLRQGVFFQGTESVDMVLIESDKPERRSDMVRIARGGVQVRYRPEFKNWRAVLRIVYNGTVFTAHQIINVLNLAGFAVGIGDWRPERDGTFGQWHVAVGAAKKYAEGAEGDVYDEAAAAKGKATKRRSRK